MKSRRSLYSKFTKTTNEKEETFTNYLAGWIVEVAIAKTKVLSLKEIDTWVEWSSHNRIELNGTEQNRKIH